MKTRFLGRSILLLIAILALTACSSQPEAQPETVQPTIEEFTEVPMEETATEVPPEPTQEEVEPTATIEAGGGEPAATAELDVDALIREKVAGHHDLDRIYNANFTREEWNATLDRMIAYGAQISEKEKQIIIDYLLSLKK